MNIFFIACMFAFLVDSILLIISFLTYGALDVRGKHPYREKIAFKAFRFSLVVMLPIVIGVALA